MRERKFIFALLFILVQILQIQAATKIPLHNITLSPAGIAHPGQSVENITDGQWTGENTIFHTNWDGIAKQTVTIEATLAGKGKRLDTIRLIPRESGYNGVIKKAALWVMVKGKYQKVADIDAKPSNEVLLIEPKHDIWNPQKLKLVVTDAYGPREKDKFMVSLGELQCEMKPDPLTNISLEKITVSPANIAHPGQGIENIADGEWADDSEIFHTHWSGMEKQDITIEAELAGKGKRLDFISLVPRKDGGNGVIKHAVLWVMVKGQYEKVGEVGGYWSNAPVTLELEKEIWNPEKVKLVVTDAYCSREKGKYMVSLGELQCQMLPESISPQAELTRHADLFADDSGVALKTGVTQKDISRIKSAGLRNFAEELLAGKYSSDGLISKYEPYQNPAVLAKKMMIQDGFSKFEGITGVVLDEGENFVFVSGAKGKSIKLMVPDWTRKPPAGTNAYEIDFAKDWSLHRRVYPLKDGINRINLSKGGLVYVQYFVDDITTEDSPVTVHFPTGRVNGYFDITRGDTNEDFNKLLKNAVSPIMDMRGEFIQIAFPVKSLKRFTKGKGVELVKNYDKIVGLQRDLLGWTKEGLAHKNHILARVNYHYYMFRDGDGMGYLESTLYNLADPEKVIKGDPCWGTSHEIGHVHQMRPQLTWGGMTEVSVNIFTLYCTTYFGNKSRLSKQNFYAKARKTILDKGISFMDFPGKAGEKATMYGGDGNTNVFERLVPFWQLHLYFKEQGYNDFYADLMIALRKQKPFGLRDHNKEYLNILEFCRLACEVSRTDLTEFFERWGFFYVGEIDVMDYRPYVYQVSQADVDKVKNAIAAMKLPKPKKDITTMED